LIALLDDPDPFIKIDAANAVGNLGFSFKDAAAEAAPKLTALLNHEQSLVRQEAAYALGNIGFAHTDLVRDAVPRLIRMLKGAMTTNARPLRTRWAKSALTRRS